MNVFIEMLIQFIVAIGAAILTYRIIARGDTNHWHRWSTWLAKHGDRLFLALAVGYITLFSTLAIIRYLTFHAGYYELTTAWDLGQYGQLVWNSLNGRLMQGTFVRDTLTFLGKSFTPIILAFVPFYALWQNPIILLIVQVVGLGLAGFPIYWFARQRLGIPLALVVAVTYFLNPGMQHIGLTEFHEIALAVPLLSLATYFLLRKHYVGLIVGLGLALLIKEEIGLIAIAFGVYIFLFQRQRRLGLVVMLFSVAWVVLLLQFLIPFFRGAEYGGTFYYFGEGAIGGGGARYRYLGRSVPEILTTIVMRPEIIVQVIWLPEKIAYILYLLVPLMFIPIVGAKVFFLALPTLGYSLLSTYPLQYEIRSYYFAPLLPFLFFALVLGLHHLIQRGTSSLAIRGALASLLIVSSGISYFLTAPGPFARYFQSWRYEFSEHTRRGNELIAVIPNDATVVGQNEFLAHLSNRRYLYEIPVIPDYRQADYVLSDSTAQWYRVHLPGWEGYRKVGYFETIVDADGFWLAKRKTPDHRLIIRYGDSLTLLGYSIVPSDTVRGGETFRPVFEWRVEQPATDSLFITARVSDLHGHLWAEEGHAIHNGATSLTAEQVGKRLGEQSLLRLPPTMPAGEYTLSLSVQISGTTDLLPARDEQNQMLGNEPIIARVRIEKDKRSYTAGQLFIEQPLFVDWREMRFLGSTHVPQSIRAGDELNVGLYWRARSKPVNDYVTFVRLQDAAGRVIIEQAGRPANGTYPTVEWNEGEVLLDWHDLIIPADGARGEYRLIVGLRDAATGTLIGETLISMLSVVD
jgi:uncharacterized membrane protein